MAKKKNRNKNFGIYQHFYKFVFFFFKKIFFFRENVTGRNNKKWEYKALDDLRFFSLFFLRLVIRGQHSEVTKKIKGKWQK